MPLCQRCALQAHGGDRGTQVQVMSLTGLSAYQGRVSICRRVSITGRQSADHPVGQPIGGLSSPQACAVWCAKLSTQDWVVYAKRPFGGPAQVLKYLARYTHRVAISNSRLLDLRDGRVTFRYQDYAHDHRQKTMTLAADEFWRRFVQHVLPRGFVKIRHYGLLTNAQREARLALCRRLLLVATVAVAAVAATLPRPETVRLEPAQPRCCPKCGGTRLVYRELSAAAPASASLAAAPDSS